MPKPKYLRSETSGAPSLRVYLNLDNLEDLRADSIFPAALLCPKAAEARDARLVADGFEGVQLTTTATTAPGTRLPFCGLARINRPEEAGPVAQRHAARGDRCITVHLGWGMEDDDAISRLVEATLTAADVHDIPIFIETHRATITQDMWRTVQITKRFPEVRFNLDLSHYYCGQEMVYGDWTEKVAFLQPLFDRVGFMHGRIASPGWMQAPIEDTKSTPVLAHGVDYLAHFRELWTRAISGFLNHADAGAELIFAPELLRSEIYYARKFPAVSGGLGEETDRYQQALLYQKLIRDIFAEVRA